MLGLSKKQRTPEQIRKRFKFAVISILVMVVIMFAGSIGHKKNVENKVMDVETAMNMHLDTLKKTFFKDTVKAVYVGQKELLTRPKMTEEEMRTTAIFIMEARKYNTVPEEELKKIEEYYDYSEHKKEIREAYFRPIRFVSPSGVIFNCYQRMEKDLKTSFLVGIIRNEPNADRTREREIQKEFERVSKLNN